MKLKTIVAVVFCLVYLLAGSRTFAVAQPANIVKGMWVWNYSTAIATQKARKSLTDFSKLNKLNLLYVNTGGLLSLHPDEFAAFIKQAHANGIQVYALNGDSSWALAANHSFALNRIQEVLDFNKAYPNSVFDGIQFDVEPYLLKEWTSDPDGTANQFLQLLQESQNKMKQSGTRMSFTVCIPFWYDEADPPLTVVYNGVSKPLDDHVLDIADSVVVMDYRDTAGNTAANRDGQIDHGKQEVDYAASIGKKAIIGAETMPPDGNGIPDNITYFDNGKTYLNAELQKVTDFFGTNPGFGGIAIHHYDSYALMKQ